LTLKQFHPFFEKLLPGQADSGDEPGRKIPEEMKTAFLNWLSAETGLKDYEITDRLGQTFADLFNEIESEYGRVSPKELDPRFVNLFLLSSPPQK
jgi:N12 class adenine-specific DNA methylase